MLSRCSETSCSYPVLETISLRILTASSLLMFSKLTSFTWLVDNSKCNYLVKSNDTTQLHNVFMAKLLFWGSAEGAQMCYCTFHLCLTCLQMPANPKLLSMGNTVNNIKPIIWMSGQRQQIVIRHRAFVVGGCSRTEMKREERTGRKRRGRITTCIKEPRNGSECNTEVINRPQNFKWKHSRFFITPVPLSDLTKKQQQRCLHNGDEKKISICRCTWRSMSPGSILPSAATAPPFMMEPM